MYADSLYPTTNSNEMEQKHESIKNIAKRPCDLDNNSKNLKIGQSWIQALRVIFYSPRLQ